MQEGSPFPPDHPASKVWNHQARRAFRHTRIQCARDGCWECHELVMDQYAEAEYLTEFAHVPMELDLQAYAAYRAVHPFPRKRGRPAASDDEVLKTLTIGRHVALLVKSGRPLESACAEVSDRKPASESSARRALRLFVQALATLVKANK
jgi:hypothetical protein